MAIQGPSLLIFSQAYGDEKRKKYHVNHPKLYFFESISTRVKKLGSYIMIIQDILALESRLLKPASRRDAERSVDLLIVVDFPQIEYGLTAPVPSD